MGYGAWGLGFGVGLLEGGGGGGGGGGGSERRILYLALPCFQPTRPPPKKKLQKVFPCCPLRIILQEPALNQIKITQAPILIVIKQEGEV